MDPELANQSTLEHAQGQKPKKPIFKGKLSNKKVLISVILVACVILGTGGFVGIEKASDNPAFCTLCHNMQPYYDSWNNSKLLANKHAAAGVTCHDCHESSVSVQVEEGWKYVTSDYKTPLDKRQFATKEFCTRCHNFSKVIPKTQFANGNPHNSHNGALECNTCHSVHQESQLLCTQCHTFEWMSTLPDYWKK